MTAGWGRRGGRGGGFGSRLAGQGRRLALTGYGLHLAGPPQAVSQGGLPPPGQCRPGGAVAAGTASEHQVPLRPRAPPLGGNGQRACAGTRLRFLPRGGIWVGLRPAAPHLGIAEINLATTPFPSWSFRFSDFSILEGKEGSFLSKA